MPIPRSRHGEKVPLVTTPPPATGFPGGRSPAPSIGKATSFSRGAGGAGRGDGLGADEAGRLLAAPAESGLDRVASTRHVVAVEVGSRPRAAACRARRAHRRGPAGHQRVPHGRRVRGVDEQLDAVLAGVAGAADEHRGAGDVRWQQCMRGGSGPSASREEPTGRRGPGPRASRIVARSMTSTSNPAPGLQPRQVVLVVGGVGDREEVAVGQPVGEEVIEDAPVLAANEAVLGAALGQPP